MQKMVEDGMFVPMTDEEIVEIRLLVSCLDKMPWQLFSTQITASIFLCRLTGILLKKNWMVEELSRYLAFTEMQKKAYSLLRRSTYMQYPLDAVNDERLMKQIVCLKLKKLERSGKDGFNKYIQLLMSYQLHSGADGKLVVEGDEYVIGRDKSRVWYLLPPVCLIIDYRYLTFGG